jgi:cytochrome c553
MKSVVTALAAVFALVSTQAGAEGDAAKGKAKSAVCAACHGADGNSAVPDFPRLAGQHADYMAHALAQYKSGKRKNPVMAGIVANLSEQDMADLAAYFESQNGLYVKY